MRLGIHTHALSSLTIKSTSHTNTFFRQLPALLALTFRYLCRRYFLRALYTCVYNARQYSVVKDLDCLGNQLVLPTYCRVCVVGPDGIEPSTSPLSGVRSSHLSYGPRCHAYTAADYCPTSGGAGRDRTGDLLSANQALSQLSYSPLESDKLPLEEACPFKLHDTESRPIGR